MASTLTTIGNGAGPAALTQADFVAQMTRERFKENYMPGARDEADVNLCFEVMRQTGLNPMLRQIYFLERSEGYGENKKTKVTPQTSIDGYRLIAERSGKRDGEIPTQWCGKDGVWHDIWAKEEAPFAARVGVCKRGCSNPFYGVAHYSEYVATKTDYKTKVVSVTGLWKKMPAQMLAKCAEALAIRKAFPQETAGIYTKEEMQQADNHVHHHQGGPVEAEFVEEMANPAVTESQVYQNLVNIGKRAFPTSEAFNAWVESQGKSYATLTENDCLELGRALKQMILDRKAQAAKTDTAPAETPATEDPAARKAAKDAWYATLAKMPGTARLDEGTANWWGCRDHDFVAEDDNLAQTPVECIRKATKALGSLSPDQVALILDDFRCSLMPDEPEAA